MKHRGAMRSGVLLVLLVGCAARSHVHLGDASAFRDCTQVQTESTIMTARAACRRVLLAGGPTPDVATGTIQAIDERLRRTEPGALERALQDRDPVAARERLRRFVVAGGDDQGHRWMEAIASLERQKAEEEARAERQKSDAHLSTFLNEDATPDFFRRCKDVVAESTIFFADSTRVGRQLDIARTCHIQAEAYRLALREPRTRELICQSCDVYGTPLRCFTAKALGCPQ